MYYYNDFLRGYKLAARMRENRMLYVMLNNDNAVDLRTRLNKSKATTTKTSTGKVPFVADIVVVIMNRRRRIRLGRRST